MDPSQSVYLRSHGSRMRRPGPVADRRTRAGPSAVHSDTIAQDRHSGGNLMEARDPFIGTILDRRYRIEERIAAGGFGAIYRASHVRSDLQLAIKVLHPRLSADERIVARFRREGATLTNLRSPHTVTTYELAEDPNGQLFIVMELLEGQTLLERFQQGGVLPWRRMVAIARAVCDALAEAHALGVVHRDLKPANIHLSKREHADDYVKVLDFGIAKLLRGSGVEDGGEELTNHNEVIGTFEYISPEQIAGDSYSGRSDIYTLGIVMYEMVTGTRPFGNMTGPALMANIFSEVPKPPSTRMPGLPPAFDELVIKCLDRDPDGRWSSVTELGAALDDLLGGYDLASESATAIGAPLDVALIEDATNVRRPSWRNEAVTDSNEVRTVRKPPMEGSTAPSASDSVVTPMMVERTTVPRGSGPGARGIEPDTARDPDRPATNMDGPELTVRRVPPPPTNPPPLLPPLRPSQMALPHRPSSPADPNQQSTIPMAYPQALPAPGPALGLPGTYGQVPFPQTPIGARASQPVINPSARQSGTALGNHNPAVTAPGLGVAGPPARPSLRPGTNPQEEGLASVFTTLEGWQAPPVGPPPPRVGHPDAAGGIPGLVIWAAVLGVAILIGVILAVFV